MMIVIVAPLPIIIKVNTRKTTGIPMDELMETTRDDPNAMLHPSGRFVKPIMHHQARLLRKYVSQCQISIMGYFLRKFRSLFLVRRARVLLHPAQMMNSWLPPCPSSTSAIHARNC
jgi:hypothetical protein